MIDIKVCLLPLNVQKTMFGGYISIQGKGKPSSCDASDDNKSQSQIKHFKKLEHITVSLDVHSYFIDVSTICCSPFLGSLLYRLGPSSSQRLKSCQGIDSFCHELEDLLSRVTILDRNVYLSGNINNSNDKIRQASPSIFQYNETVLQIENLGWDKVINVDGFPMYIDLELEMKQLDDSSRSENDSGDDSKYVLAQSNSANNTFLKSTNPFRFRATFNPANPGNIQSVEADLPRNFKIIKGDTLSSIYERMAYFIRKYKKVWEILDDLDIHSYVLEPEGTPSRTDLKRRIRIDSDVSVIFEIDPDFPKALITLNFIGPTDSVQRYEQRYVENLSLWDAEQMPRHNIETILNLQELPLKPVEGAEPTDGDCCICYSYLIPKDDQFEQYENVKEAEEVVYINQHQESRTPNVRCPEKRCGRSFHRKCLQEWFFSLQKHPILGNLTGECPFCQTNITIKI